MNKLLQSIALIGLFFLSIYFRFFVFCKVWSYVAVPMGAQPISFIQALGISLLVSLFTFDTDLKASANTTDSATSVFSSLINSGFVWALSYWVFG